MPRISASDKGKSPIVMNRYHTHARRCAIHLISRGYCLGSCNPIECRRQGGRTRPAMVVPAGRTGDLDARYPSTIGMRCTNRHRNCFRTIRRIVPTPGHVRPRSRARPPHLCGKECGPRIQIVVGRKPGIHQHQNPTPPRLTTRGTPMPVTQKDAAVAGTEGHLRGPQCHDRVRLGRPRATWSIRIRVERPAP